MSRLLSENTGWRLVLLLAVILIIVPAAGAAPADAHLLPPSPSGTTTCRPVLFSSSPLQCTSTAAAVTPATSGTLPAGFFDTTVFSGLRQPTAIRFSPDGRIFVAEQSGIILVYDSLTSAPQVFANLSSEVDNYWDRGLLGLALDPNFPATPYIYVLYTFDAPIGGTAPTWNDACPTPPGPNTDGCVVSGRLSRLQASGDAMVPGSETVLINDWCQQFASHSIGDLAFGPDGALYASGGEGASWTNDDYGQFGNTYSGDQANPCGDPPAGAGETETAPTAEGGALRALSMLRASSEPKLLNGTIIRVDPATGNALPSNPLYGNSDANAQRIVGYGLRNPFRFTIRPGTNQIWVGNVGWNTWESIDRIDAPTASPVTDFGWPCYEGPNKTVDYSTDNLNICTGLYQSGTWTAPYYTYNHNAKVVPGETCPTGSSSITGMAFNQSTTYPAAYHGALFFADYSRHCIWAMLQGANGDPDPTTIVTLEANASNPVDLEVGPNNDLFYVDNYGGTIHRITYSAHAISQLGLTSIGSTQDSGDSNGMTGSRVVVGAQADIVSSISAYIGAIDSAPNNQYSLAIYSDSNGSPGSLVAQSNAGTLNPDSWNTLPVSATLQPNTAYWLVYNTNGSSSSVNNLYFNSVSTDLGAYAAAGQPFGSWPSSFGSSTPGTWQYSLYATVTGASACQAPTAVATATPVSGAAPLTVNFDGTGSIDPNPGGTLSYAWDLQGTRTFSDSTSATPTFTYNAVGNYVAQLKVTDSACGASSTSAPITITAGGLPTPTITTPSSTLTWKVGDVINFSGSATDPQDGTLAPSQLSWTIILHHCPSTCHTHLVQTFNGVASGSFTAPDHDYPSYLEMQLTATDSFGLQSTTSVDLQPQTVVLSFASNPPGLQISDGTTTGTTPFSQTEIVNSSHSLNAISPQDLNNTTYTFASWSDGGAQSHTITAPNAATTYTATYQAVTLSPTPTSTPSPTPTNTPIPTPTNTPTTSSATTLAVEGTNQGLWARHGSGSWLNLGGVLSAAPAVVRLPGGAALYIVAGSDHSLWERTDGAGWRRLSTFVCQDNPAAVVLGNTLTVACQNANRVTYTAQTMLSGDTIPPSLSSFTSLGGVTNFGPAVAPVKGSLIYFVIGTDNRIWWRTASSSWQPLSSLCSGHPAASAYGSTTYLACHWSDGALWYATNNGSGWSAFRSAGGTVTDGPGIAATSSGALLVIESSNQADLVNQLGATGSLSGWQGTGGASLHGAGAGAV